MLSLNYWNKRSWIHNFWMHTQYPKLFSQRYKPKKKSLQRYKLALLYSQRAERSAALQPRYDMSSRKQSFSINCIQILRQSLCLLQSLRNMLHSSTSPFSRRLNWNPHFSLSISKASFPRILLILSISFSSASFSAFSSSTDLFEYTMRCPVCMLRTQAKPHSNEQYLEGASAL